MSKRILLLVICVLVTASISGQKIEKIRTNIIGSWKFDKLVNPEKPNETKICYDTTSIFRGYTYNAEGRVNIWPIDVKVFDFKNQYLTYGIYVKEIYGTKYNVLKIVTNDYQPQDYRAIDFAAGITYIITYSGKSELRLIHYSRGSAINPNVWQYSYKKIDNQ
jgi:hypothetical protein